MILLNLVVAVWLLSSSAQAALSPNALIEEHHSYEFQFQVVNENGVFGKESRVGDEAQIVFFRGHVFAPSTGDRQQGGYYAEDGDVMPELQLSTTDSNSYELHKSEDFDPSSRLATLTESEYLNETVCYLNIPAKGVDYAQYFWSAGGAKPFAVKMVDRIDRDRKVHRKAITHKLQQCHSDWGAMGDYEQFGFVKLGLQYNDLNGAVKTAQLTCMRAWYYFAYMYGDGSGGLNQSLMQQHGCGGRQLTIGDIESALNGRRPQPLKIPGQPDITNFDYAAVGGKKSFLKFIKSEVRAAIGPAANDKTRKP